MRSGPNRFKREIDSFAYSKEFGDQLAMADVEGKRHRKDDHDHLPHLWDPEPWRDDPHTFHHYVKRNKRRGKAQKTA